MPVWRHNIPVNFAEWSRTARCASFLRSTSTAESWKPSKVRDTLGIRDVSVSSDCDRATTTRCTSATLKATRSFNQFRRRKAANSLVPTSKSDGMLWVVGVHRMHLFCLYRFDTVWPYNLLRLALFFLRGQCKIIQLVCSGLGFAEALVVELSIKKLVKHNCLFTATDAVSKPFSCSHIHLFARCMNATF